MSSGFIYAICAEDTPLVKIGATKFPVAQRLAQLQIGQPHHLLLMAQCGVKTHLYAIERYIHRYFCDHRKHGEWFELSITQERLDALVDQAFQELEPPPDPGFPSSPDWAGIKVFIHGTSGREEQRGVFTKEMIYAAQRDLRAVAKRHNIDIEVLCSFARLDIEQLFRPVALSRQR